MKKVSAKISQMVSNVYSDEKIRDKAMNGTHRGESFQDIAEKIFNNPNITHETDEKTGITSMKMNDKMIGWYDKNRGIGDIDQAAYDKIKDMPVVHNTHSSVDDSHSDRDTGTDYDDYDDAHSYDDPDFF